MSALALFAIGVGTIPEMAIWLVVLIGIIAIVIVVVKVSGIEIPAWFWHILLIVALVVVAIVAIRFIASM